VLVLSFSGFDAELTNRGAHNPLQTSGVVAQGSGAMHSLNQRPNDICYAVRRCTGRKETKVLPCLIHQINVT